MARELDICTVVDCITVMDHHHLIENDDRPSVCDGKPVDDYEHYRVCCELGKRYRTSVVTGK